MSSEKPDLSAVLARLDNLERQNRRLKWCGAVLLVLTAGCLLLSQTQPGLADPVKGRTVEAENFILRDGNGLTRAALYVDQEQSRARLAFYDENGKDRMGISASGSEAGLTIYDETGKGCALLGARKEGVVFQLKNKNAKGGIELDVKDGPHLYLYDEKARTRAALYNDQTGPKLLFMDEAENWRMSLGMGDKGTGLTLYDGTQPRLGLLAGVKTGVGLQMKDENGKVRAHLAIPYRGGPDFQLLDAAENPVFTKP